MLFFLFNANLIWPEGDFVTYLGQYSVDTYLDTNEQDYNEHENKQAFDEYATRALPSISIKRRFKMNEPILLSEVFEITDNDGYIYDSTVREFVDNATGTPKKGVVHILSIKNHLGFEYMNEVYDKETETFLFPLSGQQTVQFKILDSYNVEVDYTCTIGVDLVPD